MREFPVSGGVKLQTLPVNGYVTVDGSSQISWFCAAQRIHEVEDLQNTFNTKKSLFVLGVVRLFRKVARSIPE